MQPADLCLALRRIRERHGLLLGEAAALIPHVSKGKLSEIERAHFPGITLEMVLRILAVYGSSLCALEREARRKP